MIGTAGGNAAMASVEDDSLTVAEVAELLKLNQQTVRNSL
jgi:hypothetical protein